MATYTAGLVEIIVATNANPEIPQIPSIPKVNKKAKDKISEIITFTMIKLP